MAKKTRQHKPPRTYRLYIWVHSPYPDAIAIFTRGKCIGEFTHYNKLVAEAQRRAVAAGYPKSRWGFLFDWNV